MIDWRKVPHSLLHIEYLGRGNYEISPKSGTWDKDGPFDETIYYHFVNIGLQTSSRSTTE